MKIDKKQEIKKIEDSKIFEIFRFLGLRPKKIDEKYKKYASLNRRMMASTIDTGIAMVTIGLITGWITELFIHSRQITLEEIKAIKANPNTEATEFARLLVESGKVSEFLLNSTIQMIMLLIVSAVCWKLWSATPGKILLRMKIVDAVTEKPMTNQQIMLRAFGYIPACAVFFLGIFWISFNKHRQGWHDKMAGTVVIIIPRKKVGSNINPEILIEKSIETASSSS